MTEPILRLTHVTKRFRGLTATNDVSLDLAEGTISSLIGPNGAGKSTLFNLVTGYVPPTFMILSSAGCPVSSLRRHTSV